MSEIFKRNIKGSAFPGLLIVGCRFTTSTNGDISGTPDYYGISSIVLTGSEAGRYTVTLPRASVKLAGVIATLVGPDDAALTTTKGLVAVVRDDDIATDGTCEIQFVETVTANADTDIQDGASVRLMLFLIDSGAR